MISKMVQTSIFSEITKAINYQWTFILYSSLFHQPEAIVHSSIHHSETTLRLFVWDWRKVTNNGIVRIFCRGLKLCFSDRKNLVNRFKTVLNSDMTYALPNTKGKDIPDGIVNRNMTSSHISRIKFSHCTSISNYGHAFVDCTENLRKIGMSQMS